MSIVIIDHYHHLLGAFQGAEGSTHFSLLSSQQPWWQIWGCTGCGLSWIMTSGWAPKPTCHGAWRWVWFYLYLRIWPDSLWAGLLSPGMKVAITVRHGSSHGPPPPPSTPAHNEPEDLQQGAPDCEAVSLSTWPWRGAGLPPCWVALDTRVCPGPEFTFSGWCFQRGWQQECWFLILGLYAKIIKTSCPNSEINRSPA